MCDYAISVDDPNPFFFGFRVLAGIWCFKIVCRLTDMIDRDSSKFLDSTQEFKEERDIPFSGKT